MATGNLTTELLTKNLSKLPVWLDVDIPEFQYGCIMYNCMYIYIIYADAKYRLLAIVIYKKYWFTCYYFISCSRNKLVLICYVIPQVLR